MKNEYTICHQTQLMTGGIGGPFGGHRRTFCVLLCSVPTSLTPSGRILEQSIIYVAYILLFVGNFQNCHNFKKQAKRHLALKLSKTKGGWRLQDLVFCWCLFFSLWGYKSGGMSFRPQEQQQKNTSFPAEPKMMIRSDFVRSHSQSHSPPCDTAQIKFLSKCKNWHTQPKKA